MTVFCHIYRKVCLHGNNFHPIISELILHEIFIPCLWLVISKPLPWWMMQWCRDKTRSHGLASFVMTLHCSARFKDRYFDLPKHFIFINFCSGLALASQAFFLFATFSFCWFPNPFSDVGLLSCVPKYHWPQHTFAQNTEGHSLPRVCREASGLPWWWYPACPLTPPGSWSGCNQQKFSWV